MMSATSMMYAHENVKPQLESPNTIASAEQEEDWSEDDGLSERDDGGDEDGPPSRKRKKGNLHRPLSVSCEKCKERKVKCDRGQPSCGWCLRNNKLCEYKERKKPGLRAGYGRELEARLDKQQEAIQRHEAAIAQLMNSIQGSQPSPHSELFRTPSIPGPHIPRPETALYIQKPSTFPLQSPLPSDFPGVGHQRTPSISTPHSATFPQNIQQTHSFPGSLPPSNAFMQNVPGGNSVTAQSIPADGMHPSHSPGLPATARDIYEQPNPTLESSSLNIPETRPQSAAAHNDEFPQYDLLYKLADLFFKHINTWCPILHRHTTLNRLFQSHLEQEDKILLHAIVATTLRYATDERLTPEFRERQHKISEDKVILYGMKHSSVKSLQALVILSLDLIGDSNGPPGWNMLAVLTRSVVQLGLAVESTSLSVSPIFPSIYTLRAMILPEPEDFIEEESRRRLFWVIYMLDRYATTATAFDYALEDKDIDRKLPCRDDLFNKNEPVETRWFKAPDRREYMPVPDKPENLGSISYYIEILGILSKIHNFLKKPVDIGALSDVESWQREYRELDRELQSWKYNLPNEYGNMSRVFDPTSKNKVVNCGWVMLHAAFQTTIIRLHSSAGYPTIRSPIFTPSYSAAQHCQTAVENISALNSFVRANGMLNQLGPPYAWSLWVAARVLLVHGSTVDHRVSPAINALVDTLREMGQWWKVADRYANLLQRVLDEYHESERAPEMETPSSVKILADMRRTAFDLDALISRQPRMNALTAGLGALNGAGIASRQRTPVRTPAPTDLEYLDVFDFFNMPRLPPSLGTAGVSHDGQQETMATPHAGVDNRGQNGQNGGLGVGEFNIQNFMFDVNADWFKNAA